MARGDFVMWKKWKKRLSLMQHKRARLFVLLLIVLFNLGLWLVSSLASYLIQPSAYDNFFEAIMKSGITWMMDPGFYDPDTLLSIQLIAIATVLVSMVTFTGGIIAYVSDGIGTFIDKSEEGSKKLFVYDHILVLNWNVKALELIADYATDDEAQDIVVVSNHERKELEDLIENKLYDIRKKTKQNNLNIIIIKGNIFSKQVLDRVCIQDAKTILIFSDEETDLSIDGYHADITAIKTLMLVANVSPDPKQTIIVEIRRNKTRALIHERFNQQKDGFARVIPLLSDELMGKLIAQTVFYPDLNEIYAELMSSEGAEFYPAADQDPMEFLRTHNHAIPLYRHNGKLYVVAANDADVTKVRSTPLSDFVPLTFRKEGQKTEHTVVIFGKNNKIPYSLDSIKLFETDGNIHPIVITIDSNDIETITKAIENVPSIDTILLLSDDQTTSKEIDSDVLITLLLIQDIAKLNSASIVIELMDPRHFDIAKSYRIEHTIISNRYVSHMMAQISKNRELYYLYDDLLTYDAAEAEMQTKELYVYEANQFIQGPFPKVFSSAAQLIGSVAISSNDEYQLVGLVRDGHSWIFSGNLDTSGTVDLRETDKLVILSD
jgi:hypothetical protein